MSRCQAREREADLQINNFHFHEIKTKSPAHPTHIQIAIVLDLKVQPGIYT